MDEFTVLDNLLDGLEDTTTPAAPEESSKPEPEDAPAQAPTAPVEEPAPAEEAEPRKPEEVFGSDAKRNATFARMRTENKSAHDALTRLSQALGVPGKTFAEVVANVNAKVYEFEAAKQNIPPEVLQELHNNRQQLAEYEKERFREQALLGFQKVKDTYGLTQAQLEEFANNLQTQGINPFTAVVDLDREYWLLNKDALIKNAQEAARLKEVERAAKASKHGSTPPKHQGAPEAPSTGSFKEFESFMAALPN